MSHHLIFQPRSSTAVPRLLRGAVLGAVTLALSLAAQGKYVWLVRQLAAFFGAVAPLKTLHL